MDKDSYYYYRLGEEYANKKETETAIKYFLMSLEIKKHYKTYEKLYDCYLCLDQKDLANDSIQLAYEENNKSDKVSLLYANYLIESGRLEEAEKILYDILKRNPTYKQAKLVYDKISTNSS